MGRDVITQDAATEYECFSCGFTTTGDTHPVDCPECEEFLRNRATPME